MNNKVSKDSSFKNKLITVLLVVFMPYIGIFILLIKRPFSNKTNLTLGAYCIIMLSFLLMVIKNPNGKDTDKQQENPQQVSQQEILQVEQELEQVESSKEKAAEPFYRITIEEKIEKLYSEGLDFSNMNYVQWDPMEIELYHCKNTFKGKMTKKEHSYLARVGYDRETDSSTLYYLKIDGETVFWDEEGETNFIDSRE